MIVMVSCSRAGWLEVGVGAVPDTVIQGVRLSLLSPRASAVLSGPGVPTAPSSPRRAGRGSQSRSIEWRWGWWAGRVG